MYFITPLQDKYSCHCCDTYTGHHCQELNGCINHQCLNGATCIDVAEGYDGTSYQCACPEGRSGVHCEIDTNECHSDPCLNGGVCVDLNNGYQCYCIPGKPFEFIVYESVSPKGQFVVHCEIDK